MVGKRWPHETGALSGRLDGPAADGGIFVFARGQKQKEGLAMTKSAVLEDTRRQGPPDERGHGGNGPLERVTVNLIARASRALQRVVELTGDTKTDAINRAIQVYAYLEEVEANGGEIVVRETKDSAERLLKMGVSV